MTCLPIATLDDLCCPTTCSTFTDEQRQVAIDEATRLLLDEFRRPDGSTWTRCAQVWRPCLPPCGCATSCHSCEAAVRLRIPWPDINAEDIIGVLVDGAVVTPAPTFRFARELTSTVLSVVDKGAGLWAPPATQDMNRWHMLPGTWGVALWVGRIPPLLTQAVAEVACEILAICERNDCAPTRGVTSITENGITVNYGAGDVWRWSVGEMRAYDEFRRVYAESTQVAYPAGWHDEPAGEWEQYDVVTP